jgi:hypothetical protein
MTLQQLLKLRKEQGLEAANKVIRELNVEQCRQLTIEANQAVISLATEYAAEYIDYAVTTGLTVTQESQQETMTAIDKIRNMK